MHKFSKSTSSSIQKLADIYWSRGITDVFKIAEQIALWLLIYIHEKKKKDSLLFQVGMSTEYMIRQLNEKATESIREILTITQLPLEDERLLIPERISQIVDTLRSLDEVTAKGIEFHFSDILDYLVESLLNKPDTGPLGQYITQAELIRLVMKLVDPQGGSAICDPACGTGGFLTAAKEYLWESGGKRPRRLFGMDLDPNMRRFASMRLVGSGGGAWQIAQGNALSNDFREIECYDYVFTNPPYSVRIQPDNLHPFFDPSITTSELLFIHLGLRLLVTYGILAIIVPDGLLQNDNHSAMELRRELWNNHQVEGIISLPKATNNVKTSLLIVKKGHNSIGSVWMYDLTSLRSQDVNNLIEHWRKREEYLEEWNGHGGEKDGRIIPPDQWDIRRGFFVSQFQAKNNNYYLNLSRYKPIDASSPEWYLHQSPQKIIDELLVLEDEIEHDLIQLLEQLEDEPILGSFPVVDEERSEPEDTPIIILEQETAKPKISPLAQQLVHSLHPIQQKLLNIFYEENYPLAGHEARKKLNEEDRKKFGVQEAKQTIELLEAFGLLEKAAPLTMQYPGEQEIDQDITVGDQAVSIIRWKPVEDQ